MYKSQGIATEKFGIVFRSKLEAKWAYEFNNSKTAWEYADFPWYDFLLEEGWHVEIKPIGIDFLESALKRAFPHRNEWFGNKFVVFMGEPQICISCICCLLECDKCVRVSLHSSENGKSVDLQWNQEVGFYGHYCEHGRFHEWKNPGC
jgi:hypothetical protein